MFLVDMNYKKHNGGPVMGGASQAKRGKMAGEWEDSPSQFEEELSMFDDAEMDAEEMEGQAGHDVIPVGGCCTANHAIGGISKRYFQCRKRLLSYLNDMQTCFKNGKG